MGLFNKFFKKNKEADLFQLATETKKRIAKSVNYQFCFVALKGGYFLDTYQMDSLYNDIEAVKNFYLKALLFLKEKRGLKIPKEFLDLPIHFVSNEKYKGFVLEVPLARYECECNFVGLIQCDTGE